MKPYFYNTILGILAFIVLIIPFFGKVYDGRHTWYKKLTIRGWIVCLAFLTSIVVNYLKDLQAEKDETKKAYIAKTEKQHDDSISQKKSDERINESNAKIANTFIAALAKYGYKYDSTENIIKRLVRDSSKKETKIITAEPDVSTCDIKLLGQGTDSCKLEINVCCKYASAINTYMKMNIVSEDNTGSYHLCYVPNDFYLHGTTVGADKKLTYYVIIGKLSVSVSRYYFLLIGKYEDSSGKPFRLQDYSMYDIKLKGYGIPYEPYYSSGLAFFKKMGIR